MSARTQQPERTSSPITTVSAMPLDAAAAFAEEIRAALEPLCDRIEIAGSIRRKKETVNNINVLCLPELKNGVSQFDALQERFYQRIKLVSKSGIEGRDLINVFFRKSLGGYVQIKLSIAQHAQRDLVSGVIPGNWGSLLLLHTGSASHNIRLTARAKDHGFQWLPMRGLVNAKGTVIAAEEEADIYKALGLDFIEPAERERVEF